MQPVLVRSSPLDPKLEIEDVARTLREIEWLLVVLVLLFYILYQPAAESSFAVSIGLVAFTAATAIVNYLVPPKYRNRWLVALETWLMIGFITWILYYTGKTGQIVVTLYLLPVIVTALVLGRSVTMLQVALIASCYIFVGHAVDTTFFTPSSIGHFALDIAPMLLVAYTTSMLSGDIVSAMSRMRLTSDTDALTGLYNIRAFDALARHELAQASRYNRSFSLMMLDSDHLKQVNDTYGHAAGDRLIQNVAEVTRSVVKSTDVLARYGGDEFVCLLSGAGQETALQIAERVRQRLADDPLLIDDDTVAITVSIGIATYPVNGETLDELAKNADRALYVSKAQGRDRATVYGDALDTHTMRRERAA